MAQDILTEAIPARSYTEGSALNLARAALFGVPPSKVESIVDLLRSYRGGKPNSLILGGPLGWSWQSTLDTTHHGSLAGPANAHRHSDLANIGIDDHHARDHAARHASGQPDAVSLDASQIGTGQFSLTRLPRAASGQFLEGNGVAADPIYNVLVAADIPSLDVAKITTGIFAVARGGTGLGTIATGGILYASALDTLIRIAPSAANQVLRSTGANALEIAALVAADIPSLDTAKITSGTFDLARIPTPLTGKDADTVDTYHAASLEKTANKGVASGYCDLDASVLVPLARIPATLTGKDADTVDGQHRALTINADHTHQSTGAQGGTLAVAAIASGRFGVARMPDAASGLFLEGGGAGLDPIYNALAAADIPSLDVAKITSGRFGMPRMPDGTSGYFLKAQGAGVDPAYAAVAVPTIVRKTADEIVNNSIVLQNDDHLFFAMAANEVWHVHLALINISATINPQMKLGIVLPTGASYYGRRNYSPYTAGGAEAAHVVTYFETSTDNRLFATNTARCRFTADLIVINGANAGNFQLQWAQGVATAEDTTLKANSCLIAHKLA